MAGNKSLTRDIVLEYLAKSPKEIGSQSIARALMADYPELFPSLDLARQRIRYYRGAKGKRDREKIATRDFMRPFETIRHEQFGLPDPIKTSRDPYELPRDRKRVLVIGDLHIPYHDTEAIAEALEYGYKKGVDTIILNGDIIDCYPISRFAKTRIAPRLDEELAITRSFLEALREAFHTALILFKHGNHEERMTRYILEKAPEFEGLAELDLNNLLHLTDYSIIPIAEKRLIKAGELNILHGHEYGSGAIGPVNPARTMFLKAKANIMVSHWHQVSEHTGRSVNGHVIGGWSVGHLSQPSPDYRPYNEWMSGYAYIVLDDKGMFWVSNRKII